MTSEPVVHPDKARDAKEALAVLCKLGLLLQTDRSFPNLVTLVAGEPVKGTWWAHPLANDIYMIGQRMMADSDAMFIKLLSGKTSYVHRRLWPQVVAVATSRDHWQMTALPQTVRSMLSAVDRRGSLRMDEIRSQRSAKERGDDARTLEARLLVFGDEVHTESGAHVKRVQRWDQWASGSGFQMNNLPKAEVARAELEALVASLNKEYQSAATLPWQTLRR